MPITIDRLDHLVLTVRDIDATVHFYETVLGMHPESFSGGRIALRFGQQKINLHALGKELAPRAAQATAGSADLCLIVGGTLDEAMDALTALEITIVDGPCKRTGAMGPIRSVYIRDPDENLIELSVYAEKKPRRTEGER